MPVVPAKRDESPDMPALERITISSDRASNTNNSVKPEPTPTPTSTTEESSKNANVQAKKKTTDNNNNHTNNKKVTSSSLSSSSKVIDILDLAKPSSTTVQRINALMNNQLKYIEAESKYHDELHKLQSKYSRVYADIFKRRKQIVSGECEPNLDECKWPPKINAESKNSKNDEKHSKQDKSKQSNNRVFSFC